MKEKALVGKVAVVVGGTRGAGRGIAVQLGVAGATVYVTGRSVRGSTSNLGRPETIEETAEQVTAAGGIGIPVRVDHTIEVEVAAFFAKVNGEQGGQLDILVNDIWGGEKLSVWGKPFWEQSLSDGLLMQQRAIHSHLITSHYATPLMVARKQGLIIEVTDGVDYSYRGNLYYSLVKISTIHLAEAMAADLRAFGITAVSVTPGFLRSEEMLEHFGVTEDNWRDGALKEPHFIASETPTFVGRAIAAFASDPNKFAQTGKALSSWGLSREYDFTDADGSRPHWGDFYAVCDK
ncbi:SDR family NAD(P)-dependent oxidoreductase [Paenibacillus psychroresistens]|uniref:SDR family NAD(P)-dependent oxidoreductase n=1 Tax=Paenibacillus psychroresistens TaxID=1778678 RepID=A0A6B8RVG3_9BACL|nr:SDR family oxidoreductase [Paenibacillus psychroresistens]QGQ99423.1 SDR family NAD(P)-dependent oxidoreductase [Paenibacillus psychroresistens]